MAAPVHKRRALVYGDSNTYGTDPAAGRGSGGRYGPEGRWPDILAKALSGRTSPARPPGAGAWTGSP